MAVKKIKQSQFKSLVDGLQEMNSAMSSDLGKKIDTSNKLLGDIKGHLIKSDRKKQRTDRENELEKKDKKNLLNLPKTGSLDLPSGGLFGFLSKMLLGPGGLPGFMPRSFGLKGMATLGRGVAALFLGPSFLKALESSFKEKDFTSGASKFFDEFLGKEDFLGKLGKGAILGFAVGGIKGIIPGAMLAGAFGLFSSLFGDESGEGSIKNAFTRKYTDLEKMGLGLIGGAALGARFGFGAFGIKGLVPGALIGGALGAITGYFIGDDKELKLGDVVAMVLGGALGTGLAIWAGFKTGAALGALGGPVGIIAGALIGAALGLAVKSILGTESEAEKSAKKVAQSAVKKSDIIQQERAGKISKSDADQQIGQLDKMQKEETKKLIKEVGPINTQNAPLLAGKATALAGGDQSVIQDAVNTANDELTRKALGSVNKVFGTNAKTLGDLERLFRFDEGIFFDTYHTKKEMTGKSLMTGKSTTYEKDTNVVDILSDVLGGITANEVNKHSFARLLFLKRSYQQDLIDKDVGLRVGGVTTQRGLFQLHPNEAVIPLDRMGDAIGVKLAKAIVQNDLLKTPQMGGGGSFVTSANYYNNQSSAIVQSTQEVLPFSSPTVSYGKSLGI